MKATEIAKILGKKATWNVNNLSVIVQITDLKQAFGRTDAEITPVSGSGHTWVSLDNLKIQD